MKNIFPILLLMLFIFSPSEKRVFNYQIPVMQELCAEGSIAFFLEAESRKLEYVTEEEVICKCNGRGYILSGDGITKIPCPCLDPNNKCDCKSKSKGTALPESSPAIKEVKMAEKIIPKKQILMLSSESCSPCVAFERKYERILINEGYGFGVAEYGNDDTQYHIIRRIKIEKTPELFEKYNQNGFWRGVPQFVLVIDGKPVKHITGNTTKERVLELLK